VLVPPLAGLTGKPHLKTSCGLDHRRRLHLFVLPVAPPKLEYRSLDDLEISAVAAHGVHERIVARHFRPKCRGEDVEQAVARDQRGWRHVAVPGALEGV